MISSISRSKWSLIWSWGQTSWLEQSQQPNQWGLSLLSIMPKCVRHSKKRRVWHHWTWPNLTSSWVIRTTPSTIKLSWSRRLTPHKMSNSNSTSICKSHKSREQAEKRLSSSSSLENERKKSIGNVQRKSLLLWALASYNLWKSSGRNRMKHRCLRRRSPGRNQLQKTSLAFILRITCTGVVEAQLFWT